MIIIIMIIHLKVHGLTSNSLLSSLKGPLTDEIIYEDVHAVMACIAKYIAMGPLNNGHIGG